MLSKDLNTTLRTALMTALNGHITLSGSNVPVYDRVPKSITYPFVVIQLNEINDDARTKDTFAYRSTFTINVVTGYDGNYGGQADADSIADSILQLLGTTLPASYINLGSVFKMITLRLQSAAVIESQTDTHYIVQKSLIFSSIIDQLT